MFYRASEVNDTWLFLRPARSIYRFSWIGQDGPDGITLVSLHELVFSFILVFCWTSSWVFMRNEDKKCKLHYMLLLLHNLLLLHLLQRQQQRFPHASTSSVSCISRHISRFLFLGSGWQIDRFLLSRHMGESVYTCIAVRKRILPVNSHEEKTKELEFTGDTASSDIKIGPLARNCRWTLLTQLTDRF